ncbi:MAG: patatin-like phospholipase family protein [Tetrasphaera sp.]
MSLPSLIDVLRERYRAGSTPGSRRDDYRVALVIEGGSARGAFSSGMTVPIEDLGLLRCLDAAYGSSAGTLNAAWLLCGRARETIHAWWTPEIMHAVISTRNPLRRKPIVDTRHLVETVYEEITPMDFAAILASPVSFHPLATDADDGVSVDLATLIHDTPSLKLALRATTSIPIVAGGPVRLGGRRFIDAGVTELVPVRTALADGATHVLALRTKRPSERPQPPSRLEQRAVRSWLVRKAPGAVTAWAAMHARHTEEEWLLAGHPGVLQIRPPEDGPVIGMTHRDLATLRAAVEAGYAAAWDALAPVTGQRPGRVLFPRGPGPADFAEGSPPASPES